MKKVLNYKILLILICFLAAFLRLWKLDKIPVSLFGDELDVGYHAYSIFKTGKDYQGNFIPLHFHSLAEWRTPLYLYSCVPTVGIFGISAWGVRLPAAFFGIFSIYIFCLLVKEIFQKDNLALISAFLLALSPWHIQYSRAGFEVTQLILFILLGFLFFFKALKNEGKNLWLSTLFFAFTPWIYSSAKFFTPFLLLFLLFIWKKDIFKFKLRNIIFALVSLVIVGGPIAYSTLFSGGSQRFEYISIFSDPTTEPEVGVARQNDARVRGEMGEGLTPTLVDRIIHNKFTFWGENVIKNYISSFSTNFFFVKGDLNLRHSIGIGQFYKVEFIALILGIILFFTSKFDKKYKWLIGFWILFGAAPSSITREGANHATRLILMLPPLIFLISYGVYGSIKKLKRVDKLFFSLGYLGLFLLCFIFYQHKFWIHYPWASERWWHTGYEESIKEIKKIDKDYDKVVISTANEPPWIFFAGWYEYPPDKWQKEYPIENKTFLEGFGEVSYIDKFYFGTPQVDGLYSWGQIIDDKTLYLASEKEVKVNLILEPDRTPGNLRLLKAIKYPSGEPAFYLFTGNK
ncbi:glycosyltransferase family 39 protein [Patescibacteria group bacterium]